MQKLKCTLIWNYSWWYLCQDFDWCNSIQLHELSLNMSLMSWLR